MNNLDFEKLLDSSEYKEQHRASMVTWGEQQRKTDSGYFCKQLLAPGSASRKPVWIIADVRRKTDIQFFDKFTNLKLRVEASQETRQKRNWIFISGVDDGETENDLDSYQKWDFVIDNDGNTELLEKDIDRICEAIKILIKDDQ